MKHGYQVSESENRNARDPSLVSREVRNPTGAGRRQGSQKAQNRGWKRNVGLGKGLPEGTPVRKPSFFFGGNLEKAIVIFEIGL